ncbi:MAG: pilus assembly protein PilM [Limisphaerales bacterium]
MLGSKSFLCIDFGAGSLKVAEFDVNEAGAVRLLRYGMKPLGLAGSQDSAREGVVLRGLQELMSTGGFAAKSCNVCAPGYHAFSKFVKLPPVDSSKVTQIIQYEAQQNVPFPLEEVVWDYQILGSLPSGELEVLLVAIKSNIVEGLFKASGSIGLRLDLVDASPAALCNAFRYNYGDLEGCSMLLDIGAKTSNVLFFEKAKVFCRSINIGANSITQDFAAEAKMPFAEAEKFKIAEGFVSLGGAYEDPENPKQAAISKIARQVLTRLHIQVNQTIQFYRSQQGGSAPLRVFLAGGASIMPYTAQFFAEKLNLGVEYFNPLRNVQIDPSVNLEELAKVAHAFGEVVGIGLRTPAQCPVELNLIPKSILQKQQLSQKQPYFVATAVSLILVVFAVGWFYSKLAAVKLAAVEERQPKIDQLLTKEGQLKSAETALLKARETADQYTAWLSGRTTWAELVGELRGALERTEKAVTAARGFRAGAWIERMSPDLPQDAESGTGEGEGDAPRPMMDIRMLMRYGMLPKGFQITQAGGEDTPSEETLSADGAEEPTQPKKESSTNTISTVSLTCRGVSWNRVMPTADAELAQALLNELTASAFFVGGTNGTRFEGSMMPDDSNETFQFEVKLKLAKPIEL